MAGQTDCGPRESNRRRKLVWPRFGPRCAWHATIQALGEGYDVYIVTDASGGVSVEAHDMAFGEWRKQGRPYHVDRSERRMGNAIGRASLRLQMLPRS